MSVVSVVDRARVERLAAVDLDHRGHRQVRRRGLSNTTAGFIYTFERSGQVSKLMWRTRDFDGLESFRATLEAVGVEFVNENGGGAGVRLKKA